MAEDYRRFIWNDPDELIVPQCADCIHYLGKRDCKAYPRRIPYPIFSNEVDHTKPYRNDNGIRFEEKKT